MQQSGSFSTSDGGMTASPAQKTNMWMLALRAMEGGGGEEKSPKGAATDSHQSVIINGATKRWCAIRQAQRMDPVLVWSGKDLAMFS